MRLVKKPVVFAVRLTGAVFSRALPREKPVRHRSSVVEHTLGKGEVTGSSPVGGFESRNEARHIACVHPSLAGQAPESGTPRWVAWLRFVASPIGHPLNPTAGISEKPADG